MPATPAIVTILLACVAAPALAANEKAANSASGGPHAAILTPSGCGNFVIAPDWPSSLTWQSEGLSPGQPLNYEILNYTGDLVGKGAATVAPGGSVIAGVKLPPGYYEIRFPAADQAFSVVSLAAFSGRPDSFFGIDASLGALEQRPEVRQQYVDLMARIGIASVRERFDWEQLLPGALTGDFESPRKIQSLRKMYADAGISVLEVAWNQGMQFEVSRPDDPNWNFRRTRLEMSPPDGFPQDLCGAAQAWLAVARRFGPNCAGTEVWDDSDRKCPRADQYVAMLKAMAYAYHRAGIKSPIVMSNLFGSSAEYGNFCAANGLLDCCDAMSFRASDAFKRIQDQVYQNRVWLGSLGKGAMPLWCRGSGSPWQAGRARPTRAQDAAAAMAVAAQTATCRANGVAKYFAFRVSACEENGENFGMTGRDLTPLRSLAAYGTAIQMLASQPYRGDLELPDVVFAHVFGTETARVAVICTGRVDPHAKLAFPFTAMEVLGIDGRRLSHADDGFIPVPDGLTYVYLGAGASIRTGAFAVALNASGRQSVPPRLRPAPVVLRSGCRSPQIKPMWLGYEVDESALAAFPLTVKVHNLSDSTHRFGLHVCLPDGTPVPDSLKMVEVSPGSSTSVDWTIDLSRALSAEPRGTRLITVSNIAGRGEIVSPLAIALWTPPSIRVPLQEEDFLRSRRRPRSIQHLLPR